MSELSLKHRAVIKFLTKEGSGAKVTHERRTQVYGTNGPFYFQAKYWSRKFRWGPDSFQDDPGPETPVEQRTEETIGLVED